MGIKFKSFLNCLPYVVETKLPVMMRARHGVGKSSLVYQFAKGTNLKVVERRASQMQEGDLLGLPKIEKDCTTWLPPKWFLQACKEPVLLFMDEIDRACTEVRQGFFELTDSRKLAGWHLHEDTLIFAACNSGESGSEYQVADLDPAELDRWTVFDLDPDVEDWLTWAKDNVIPAITDFIRQSPSHLEHTSAFEPNKVYPSRRSWHRFSDCLKKSELLDVDTDMATISNLATSFIGLEGSIAYIDFLRNYNKIVTPDDILKRGKFEMIKDFEINDHLGLIEKMETKKCFTKKMTKKEIENLVKYFQIIPSELKVKVYNILTLEDSETNRDNLVKFNQSEIEFKGKKVEVGYYFAMMFNEEANKEKEKEDEAKKDKEDKKKDK